MCTMYLRLVVPSSGRFSGCFNTLIHHSSCESLLFLLLTNACRSFLKKLKSLLGAQSTGSCVLIPVMVEGKEILLLLHRITDTAFKMVVVQTDPFAGLQYHDSQASPPIIKYRTCLVLDNIPKKFALDDVFWMALFNMTIAPNSGDTDKFYGVLLPFLTGKPLETTLAESRTQSELRNPQVCGHWNT